jgi:hypothetical protein
LGPTALAPGGSTTYTILLSASPAGTVTVTPTYSNTYITITPTNFDFNNGNYNNPQTFTINTTASSPASDVTVLIKHTVVTTDDADKTFAAFVVPDPYAVSIEVEAEAEIVVSGGSPVVHEGETGSYAIFLASQPTADVTINISNANAADVNVSPASLTFTPTNWHKTQTVEVKAVVGATARGISYTAALTHAVVTGDAKYGAAEWRPGNVITATIVATCRAGWYAWAPGSGVCGPCPPGKSCLEIYKDPNDCTSGTYSKFGDSLCYTCPPGHSCGGTTEPEMCESGAPNAGKSACTTCAAGKLCSGGQEIGSCGDGTEPVAGEDNCTICEAGKKCVAGVPTGCAGTEFAFRGSPSCGTAADGVVYNTDAGAIVPCTFGTYATGGSDCTACGPGKSCDRSAETGDCADTQYSIPNTGICLECPVGTKCALNAGAPTACTPGTYANVVSQNTCASAVKGQSALLGLDAVKCPPGYITAADDQDLCIPVLVGETAPDWS